MNGFTERPRVRCVGLSAFLSMVLALATGCGGSSSSFPPNDSGPGGSAAGGSATGGSATGGSATGGTGASGAAGASGSECTSSADCSARTDGRTKCDVSTGTCVACMADTDCGSGQRCVANACQSAPCTSSLDCPTGTVCNPATRLCVDCTVNADCKSGETCVGNVCRPPCRSDKDCTPLGLLCNATSGTCVDCVSSADCPAARYCNAGSCAPDVCVAGTSDCVNDAVVTCNADGSGTLPPVACSSTQTCVRSGTSASCVDQICSPLVKGCNSAEQVVACSGDGLTESVLEDCGAKGQVCVAATCKPVVCTAGALFCSGAEVRQCSPNGDSSVLVATCDLTTQFCNPAAPACTADVCTPSQPACNGNVATTCKADGSGYASGGVDCGSQRCVGGSCTNLICSPNTRFCSNGTIQQCSADGTSSSLYATCSSTQFCDAASVTCKAQICSPNAPACNGNVATTCNADGSGYVTGGIACTTGQVCVSGACKNVVCTPNARSCSGGSVVQCSADGTSLTLYQSCTASQYCDAASATCKAQICTPNQLTCNGNSVATCNADGSGYASAGSSCGAQYCVNGACQNAMFIEDWEDGDYAGWSAGTDSYTRSVTTAQAANGTLHSLVQTGGGNHQQGLYRTFANLAPTSISWWVMPTTTTAHSGYFVLSSGATTNYIVWIYFQQSTALLRNYLSSGAAIETPYVANQWYHLEMRNINWTTHTYDYYVNGALFGSGVAFYTAVSYLTRLDLYNYSSSTAYWDEIVFQ